MRLKALIYTKTLKQELLNSSEGFEFLAINLVKMGAVFIEFY